MALTTSQELLPLWNDWAPTQAPGVELRGLGAATAGDSGAGVATVILASTPAIDPDGTHELRPGFARALGVSRVEMLCVPAEPLASLIKQWLYQAAQGTGRGIMVKFKNEILDDAHAPIDIQVWAIDSSARELVRRLGSPHEADLAALRALLGGREVTVRDVEQL